MLPDDECVQAFHALIEQLYTASALGMSDYEKDFFFFIHERSGCSLSVLTQKHGEAMRPLGYFSTVLNNVAAALPGCLKAVAAVSLAIKESEGIVT